ncbi:helix-turn-helix domain-containing protein [Rhodococcus marinonascens]|uniref:helix-turn-helix domain-containing protein n=1 Tax=Rhodococcus marinonascens TaxID=38311 RepID=UPI00093448A9
MSRSQTALAVISEIKAQMARRDVTATRLAAGIGISRGTVGRFLRGESCLDLDLVEDIADFLGMDAFALIDAAGANAVR